MNNPNPIGELIDNMVEFLARYNEEKKKEGLVPTIDLLIEDLKTRNFND